MGSPNGREADDPRIDRHDAGITWFAYPNEDLHRASHALATAAGVYVVEPVDATGIDEAIADLGEVVGTVVAVDRHKRDAATLANRHDVPVFLPHWMSGVARDIDAPVEQFGSRLPHTGYRVLPVINNPIWTEYALHDLDGGTLLVPETVGSSSFYCARDERLGIHPALRAFPPRDQLGDLTPDRVLVGHGDPVTVDAAGALTHSLRVARRNAVTAWMGALRAMVRVR